MSRQLFKVVRRPRGHIVWSPAAAGNLFSVRVSADPQTLGTALQTYACEIVRKWVCHHTPQNALKNGKAKEVLSHGHSAAAPALASSREVPSALQISVWLNDADGLIVCSDSAKRGIAVLESMLLSARPVVSKSALLPNYPNPFNPETWIPSSETRLFSRFFVGLIFPHGIRSVTKTSIPTGATQSFRWLIT